MSMKDKERVIQYCAPEELIPYENNPRDNRLAVDEVVMSLEEYGFTNPILVNEDMVNPCRTYQKRGGNFSRVGKSSIYCVRRTYRSSAKSL